MFGTSFGNSASSGGAAFEFGNALEFDGVNDKLTGSTISLTGEYSFFFWVKFKGSFPKVWFGSSWPYDWYASSSVYYWQGYSGSEKFTISPPLEEDVWYCHTITRNASNLTTLYINGVQIDTCTRTGTFTFDNIGGYSGLDPKGVLDELYVYDGIVSNLDDNIAFFNDGNGIDLKTRSGFEAPNKLYRFNGSNNETFAVDEGSDDKDYDLNYFTLPGAWVAHTPVFSFGNALEFDGVNDYVSPNTNLSNLNDVSLSCWINAKTTSHNYNVLLANSTGAQYFGVRIVSGLIRFTGFGIFNSFNTSNTFVENTWFHVGIIQSGNSVSYYYNGVLQGTVGGASKRSDIDLIGKYGGAAGGGLKLKGSLDEYVFWDTALTDSQMKNQYNLGAGNFADADVTPLVYYSCNQADGTTPLDNDGSGGSSYNGRLNNFATPYFVPHTLDTDAAAFISAAAITGATQKLALNQLVLDLKGTGSTTNNSDVFSDLYALYPTCPIDGSTQTLTGYSFNIVDPLSYQITWVNAPTFDSTGVIFTGTQYGNTNFDIATDPDSFTSFGTGVDVLSFSSGNGAFMGAYDGGSQAVQLLEISSTFGGNIFDVYTVKATLTGGSNLKSVIRRTLSDMESYENGISVNTNTTTISTPSPSSAVITIAARSSLFPKTCKLGVSFISKGLSDNQSKDLFDSITTYNTALGR